MKKFKDITSKAIALKRINIDTDAIIPSREMKRVSKKGLSEGLFAGWRYLSADSRKPDPAFVLNDPAYAGAQIIIAGANFGCGSSREHAVWALHEYGIRVIIAPSFGAIFYKNCVRNGILPIILSEEDIEKVEEPLIEIDLERQLINGWMEFDIQPSDKDMLLRGLDDIDLNFEHLDAIKAFEQGDRETRPWAYL